MVQDFQKGDKVVYRSYGAGKIIDIKEEEYLGKISKFYIIKLLMNDIIVALPFDKIQNVGLRKVVDEKEIEEIFKFLKEKISENKDFDSKDWRERYLVNLNILKSGEIKPTAQVIKYLYNKNKKKRLSSIERRLFDEGIKMLASEISLVKEIELKTSEEEILKCLKEGS